ncbi:thioredoxin-disulfide reductase [Desulfococcaceae bacterium HSG7]|nr:thioredoxin-disulfide reductase [Desulfococcaceae bacterium HSG7]
MQNVDYDLVIIGGGPAGLTAGMYAARSRLNVILIERMAAGGQTLVTDWIENYPGFPDGLSGAELSMKMSEQAQKFGIAIEYGEVQSLDLKADVKTVRLADKLITCHAIILATGASPRKLGVPGEDMLIGKGISFCGTCDGPFYKDKIVAAVGGGNTAVQESVFLTKFAKKVILIHRRDELRATRILQERAFENDKIEILWDSVVTSVSGGLMNLDTVNVENVKTGEDQKLSVDGCFIWVGIQPNAGFLGDAVKLDDNGFVITDQNMAASVPGVFAAGDGRRTPLRQVATAVGDGAIAAFMAEHYIENIKK